MGQTVKNLSEREVTARTIFNHRFVVEVCEQIHVHYRNLRILMSVTDFKEMAKGMADALRRYEAQGSPEVSHQTHIELCRKDVAKHPVDEGKVRVNLNKNLYKLHEGKIFADGAELDEPLYIHLKLRDLRLELTIDDFNDLATACEEAKAALAGGVHAE